MKRLFTIIISLAAAVCTAQSQELQSNPVSPQEYKIERQGDRLNVSLALGLEEFRVPNNRMVVLTPRLVNGKDTLNLSTVGVFGRRRYIYYQRNEKTYPEAFQDENIRSKDMPDTYSWAETVPFAEWMDGASVQIHRSLYGCCNDIIDEDVVALGLWEDLKYVPEYIWIVPPAELEKVRFIEGSAFVDFPVSETVIYPDYRDNRKELGKIIASIDSLNQDGDITLKSLFIKGFASPESPYDNNTRLAKGRTKALKEYVSQLYKFEDGFIQTDFEPEDWAGLRKFVDGSNINHRQEILDIIDGGREPDVREWILKSTYPDEYKFLLTTIYPALRHSDYKIEYKIVNYDDLDKIERVFMEAPGKLSLREMYNLSTRYTPGSEEFNHVFEVAAMVYSSDPTANLNAANVAMGKNDMQKASVYLDKAGDSPFAIYARAIFAAENERYDEARTLFVKAAEEARNTVDASDDHVAVQAEIEAEKMNRFITTK